MTLQTNPQLVLAADYVRNTHKNVFLTGRAGTGKTTFLHQLKNDSHKRMVVVAPTGVAAINAGGVTIHSFFQLPFGPFLPQTAQDITQQRKFSGEKLNLIRSLDLLVIDEISMVRADLLDGIDAVLRRYRDRNKPFGGVQLLMIGDLHQLPPIVKDEEWAMLQPHYSTAYFFGSHALQQTLPVAIELKHIYRQADNTFIDLLNKVRDNRIDAEVLAQLNSRYIPDFAPTEAAPYITLTSHNATATLINGEKLNALTNAVHTFAASIDGDFPTFSYPTEAELLLKEGAQVMFVKNDTSHEKLFYNGKIGKIVRITPTHIFVQCAEEPTPIMVGRLEWQNLKYTLNATTKTVEEDIIGTFTQFPLKLAWAITIHKSQGLTFERAIIDANAAFAHGQVYVALSRCKTFEGIVLRSRLAQSSIRTDTVVRGYSEDIDKNAPTEADLTASKIVFQQTLIRELFDTKDLKYLLSHTQQAFLGNEHTLNKAAIEAFKVCYAQAQNEILAIAEKFVPQMDYYLLQAGLPQDNTDLQARLQKSGVYFETKLKTELFANLQAIAPESDNKSVLKTAKDALDALKKEVFIKNACFVAVKNGFSPQAYLRAKADGALDYAAINAVPKPDYTDNTPHGILKSRLKKWRDDTAADRGSELYLILPAKTLDELLEKLPISMGELAQIKGMGATKLKHFGTAILKIIQTYCSDFAIDKEAVDYTPPPPKPPKPDTKQVSLDLFNTGKTVAEIAVLRGLTAGTIETHLAHFIASGDLHITQVMPEKSIADIKAFFANHPTANNTEAFAHFSGSYSYNDLRMVVSDLKLNSAE